MDRRDFLKRAAAASVAGTAVAGSGCATTGVARPPQASSIAEMDAFLVRFDRGLELIGRGGPFPSVLAPGVCVDAARVRAATPLFQRTVRVLYAAGAFGELEPVDQLHPGVQDRMQRLLPEIDGVMDEHRRLLAGLRPSDHARLQRVLRTDPGLPLRIAETLDETATENGLGPSRRGRLRLAATEIGTRLRTQPPELLVGEYLDKARRIEERSEGVGARQRALAARMGESAFWDGEAWAEREALAWRERLLAAGSAGGEPAGADGRIERPSARTARRGAALLGIGVGAGGLCLALTSGVNFAFVFGVTAGVILVLIGLLVLLAALMQRAGEGRGPYRPEGTPAAPEAPPAVPPSTAPPEPAER